ncbi:hypothetical protein INT45_009027 [Circinella minor]|uniref:Uncharacterized protein n=1 Tax=Circinella minor TaxID=1195481 RepID=A0A8H7SAI9_9FUNG|nr:hypothetical protein INT45_009027 [Circinella minor]
MEKSLSDYDQSLEALEKQRKELELVMKQMGQEWEASGAGIGWLDADNRRAVQQQQSSSGPSPEYLRSLLNVNEALLAQSLANISEGSVAPVRVIPSSCPLPSPNSNNDSEPILTNKPMMSSASSTYTTPPITPDESQPLGTRLNYTHTMDPIAELKTSSSTSSSLKSSP